MPPAIGCVGEVFGVPEVVHPVSGVLRTFHLHLPHGGQDDRGVDARRVCMPRVCGTVTVLGYRCHVR